MNRTLRTAVMTALLLAAGNSWALGLGQIQVKSKRNQPLVAEIPIISTTPGELAALQARLASPETFRRIGLSPPSGVAADLQFSLGSDGKGRPVIRVTTLKPVDQGALNFLIEVDWGTGRLVREYSALVDTPDTAAAGVQPSVQLPQAPAANLVQRPQPALPAAVPVAPTPAPIAATNASAAPAEPVPVATTPEPLPAPAADIAPAPAPLPVAIPTAVTNANAAAAAQYGPVKRGETLSKIASAVGLRAAFSLDQSMLALLRANPDAFLGDDINRLRSGSVLRVPGHDDVAKIDAGEATQVVRQQMQQWQQARHAVRQPDAATTQATLSRTPAKAVAAPESAEAKPTGKSASQTVAKPARTPAAQTAASRKPAASAKPATAANVPASEQAQAKPQRQNEARLQIVPPTGPGKATGMKSGTDAGGKGSMLQQELRQRDEDIAAKSAEIGELKERVAALEKLKDEQQKLISLKDTELATAQAHLAQANQAQAQAQAQVKPQTAALAAETTTNQPVPPPDAPKHKAMPYVWGGVGFAALALLAWLLAGRRKPAAAPVRRSVFDSEALAASMGSPKAVTDAAEPAPEPIFKPIEDAAEQPAAAARAAPTPARTDTPAWHSGWVKADPEPAEPAAPVAVVQASVQPEPALAPAAVATAETAPAHASIEQRFKLVDAFLDMGDKTSAQQILAELLNDEDDAASEKAGRMLSKLMG